MNSTFFINVFPNYTLVSAFILKILITESTKDVFTWIIQIIQCNV